MTWLLPVSSWIFKALFWLCPPPRPAPWKGCLVFKLVYDYNWSPVLGAYNGYGGGGNQTNPCLILVQIHIFSFSFGECCCILDCSLHLSTPILKCPTKEIKYGRIWFWKKIMPLKLSMPEKCLMYNSLYILDQKKNIIVLSCIEQKSNCWKSKELLQIVLISYTRDWTFRILLTQFYRPSSVLLRETTIFFSFFFIGRTTQLLD